MSRPGADPAEIKQALAILSGKVESYLEGCLKGRGIPPRLLEAMEYSLLAGGKRLRPALCLCFAQLFGLEHDRAMPFAAALELIHTYSLVHDDLPAMDNDDMRRGKPSNHVAHGEAVAILAGDGLLTEAFALMASAALGVAADRVLSALGDVARAVGAAGMVGGQTLDMDYTGRSGVSLEELRTMHSLKTGALLQCSCVSGALLAGAPEEDLARVRQYGQAVGVAFQIMDDVLDEIGDEKLLGKPVGSDREQGKTTYPSLVGLERSRVLAEEQVRCALDALAVYPDKATGFLKGLARYMVERIA